MHRQDFVVDQGRNRQAVEAVRKHFPQSDGVTPFAFVVEAVNAINTCTLVVAAQEEKVLWVLDLVCKQ